MRNDAVVRAIELLTGAEVARCEKMLSNPGFVNKAPDVHYMR